MGYSRGDSIKLRAFGGKRIVRRFVEKRGRSVLICSHEEYELALRENRKPLCIGFRQEDVITDKRPPAVTASAKRPRALKSEGGQ